MFGLLPGAYGGHDKAEERLDVAHTASHLASTLLWERSNVGLHASRMDRDQRRKQCGFTDTETSRAVGISKEGIGQWL